MSGIEIPARAVDAAYTCAYDTFEQVEEALKLAGPIIVAAYMRHLGDIYPGGMSPERLRSEAQRLDPEGGAGG